MNIKEMISIIQIYIYHLKGVEVDISMSINPLQVSTLLHCYDIAKRWCDININEIKKA